MTRIKANHLSGLLAMALLSAASLVYADASNPQQALPRQMCSTSLMLEL